MEYLVYIIVGFAMGLFGGMLGIGGSVIMIPALTFCLGPNQHLYQASAMICNFFVASASLIAHRKAQAFVRPVLKLMIPAAMAGILIGVAISNCSLFARQNGYLLARIFGYFLIYVIIYNVLRLFDKTPLTMHHYNRKATNPIFAFISSAIGMLTGIGAGFLGIGAGTVSTPLQQLLLDMPIKNAMSNSAATIAATALIGAAYKNLTLSIHNISMLDSLKVSALILPTAIVGGFLGGHLMHILPRRIVRIAFLAVLALAVARLITIRPTL